MKLFLIIVFWNILNRNSVKALNEFNELSCINFNINRMLEINNVPAEEQTYTIEQNLFCLNMYHPDKLWHVLRFRDAIAEMEFDDDDLTQLMSNTIDIAIMQMAFDVQYGNSSLVIDFFNAFHVADQHLSRVIIMAYNHNLNNFENVIHFIGNVLAYSIASTLGFYSLFIDRMKKSNRLNDVRLVYVAGILRGMENGIAKESYATHEYYKHVKAKLPENLHKLFWNYNEISTKLKKIQNHFIVIYIPTKKAWISIQFDRF